MNAVINALGLLASCLFLVALIGDRLDRREQRLFALIDAARKAK